MDRRPRYLPLVVALWAVVFAGACLCGQCGSPVNRPAQERPQESTPIVSGADLGEAVMARAIGKGNRPIGITDTFSGSEDVIYCVVEARRIDAGTSFCARWLYEDEPFEDTPAIIADRNYTNTYVEFHIAVENFGTLKSGQYACEIYVNGNLVKTVEFTVQ